MRIQVLYTADLKFYAKAVLLTSIIAVFSLPSFPVVSEKQLPYTVTVSLRILTGFSFAHQVRCNLCVITLHIFNSDILFLSHFNKNVNTIRVYFPLMFGISVTVHSVHSNVAKIHSRLPAAMEFWLVCILSRYSLHFCQGFEKNRFCFRYGRLHRSALL